MHSGLKYANSLQPEPLAASIDHETHCYRCIVCVVVLSGVCRAGCALGHARPTYDADIWLDPNRINPACA
jgi:hypothetical protein